MHKRCIRAHHTCTDERRGRRVSGTSLSAAVPTASLVHAVDTAMPRVVVLWSQSKQTALSEPLRALGDYPLRRVAAGPGWSRLRLGGVEKVNSLSAAVDVVLEMSKDTR